MTETPKIRMSALSYLYDHIQDLPPWVRKLTPGQLEDFAVVMTRWELGSDHHAIVPLEELEQREVLRAISLCRGNVIEAAQALKIGKTTLYNKLKMWGYTVQDRILHAQASVLAAPKAAQKKDRAERFW